MKLNFAFNSVWPGSVDFLVKLRKLLKISSEMMCPDFWVMFINCGDCILLRKRSLSRVPPHGGDTYWGDQSGLVATLHLLWSQPPSLSKASVQPRWWQTTNSLGFVFVMVGRIDSCVFCVISKLFWQVMGANANGLDHCILRYWCSIHYFSFSKSSNFVCSM